MQPASSVILLLGKIVGVDSKGGTVLWFCRNEMKK